MRKIIIPIITILIIFFIILSSIYLYKINELKKYNKQLEDNIYKYNELNEEMKNYNLIINDIDLIIKNKEDVEKKSNELNQEIIELKEEINEMKERIKKIS